MNIKENPIFRDAKCLTDYTGAHSMEDYIKATKPLDNVYVDFDVNIDQSTADDMIEQGKVKPFDTTQKFLKARTYIKRDASNDRAYCRTFLFNQDDEDQSDTFILYDIGDISSLAKNFPFVIRKASATTATASTSTASTKTTKAKTKKAKVEDDTDEESPEEAAAKLRELLSGYNF